MRVWDELIKEQQDSKEQQDRKKRLEAVVKKCLTGAVLIGAAVLLTGFYDGDQVLVEEVYTVQKGDTLRHIAEEYLPKNTGGRRYILEFQEGIIENNPELQNGNSGNIHPGQKLKITYWVKKETSTNEQ